MKNTLGDLFMEHPEWLKILSSVLPGGEHWGSYIDKDGDCMRSCPSFKKGSCSGPDNLVCSEDWKKSEASPDVLAVLFHTLNNFDHYNQNDLPKLNRDHKVVKELIKYVHDLDLHSMLSFDEGELKLRMHYYRERNSQAAQKRKERALKFGEVVCEGCKTDFYKLLNDLSISVIECHHKIPLSSSKHKGKTSPEDLILLCANCHRLIHSKEINLSLYKLRRRLKLSKAGQ